MMDKAHLHVCACQGEALEIFPDDNLTAFIFWECGGNDSLRERIKRAWKALCGHEYVGYDFEFDKKTLKEIRDDIDSILPGMRDESDYIIVK